MLTKKFELGTKVRDVITGFEGVTTGYIEYITGCNQFLVTPAVDKEKKHVYAKWFDETRLKKVGNSSPIKLEGPNGRSGVKGACEAGPIK